MAYPPSVEQPPVPTVWPCGCPYAGPHHTNCMWSLWEEMRANYQQTKTVLDGLQPGEAKTRVQCECSCQALGLQQMLGVTMPWLKPPTIIDAVADTGLARQVEDTGNYTSESRKLIEEQQRVKKTWEQFIIIFDIAMDLANDMSKKDWGELARLRKELERVERQERREEERHERQQRRETKCAEDRSKSKEEEGEGEPCQPDDAKKRTKKKSVEKKPKKEKEQKGESKQESEKKPPPETPRRRSTKEEEPATAKEEPDEGPQPETTKATEEEEVAEVVEGAEEGKEAEAAAEQIEG